MDTTDTITTPATDATVATLANATTLRDVVQQINELHQQCGSAMLAAVERCWRMGSLLNQAKALLPRGDFASWVELHTRVPHATAYRYLKLYRDNMDGAPVQFGRYMVAALPDGTKNLGDVSLGAKRKADATQYALKMVALFGRAKSVLQADPTRARQALRPLFNELVTLFGDEA